MLEIGCTYIKKISGPITDPCGTPLRMLVGGDIISLILMEDVRLVINEVNHLRGDPSISRFLSVQ